MTTIERPRTGEGPARARRASAPLRPHVLGAIFRRNFLGYFSNPAGYVFITLFVLASSWVAFGVPAFFTDNLADLHTLNRWMPYLLLFFIPAITMSVWAEERRQGTDELLLTLPARDVEVVLGKYLAALGIYTVALAFSLSHIIVLLFLGRPDPGVMAATYFGYWLMGAMLIALGMVASMLSSNATVAFILGGLLGAAPVFADLLGSFVTGLPGLGGVGRALEALSVPAQFRDFGSGVVRLSSVLYFLGLAVAMLYLNMVLLGRRHWAGGPRGKDLWLHYVVRVVAAVLALASLDALAARAGLRSDVSAERLSTLSPESRALIRAIPESRPVFLQAYYSPDVPREYVETRDDLLNLLREIGAVGGSKVQISLVPTERYSETAIEAEKRFGITARRVFTRAEGRASSQEIFLGVAFTSGPEQVVIPFLDRGLPVEYELIRSLRVASGAKRKKVGVLQTDAKLLGGFDFRAMGQDPDWEIVTELKKQYEVASVPAEGPFPADLDALVVAQPSSLAQPAIDALSRYIQGGGPTLLLCDPLTWFDPAISATEPKMPPGGPFSQGPPPVPKGDLTPLMEMLGVTWPADLVVWNRYNPHPNVEDVSNLNPEVVFISPGSGIEAFGKDPASSGLQEVVMLFGGMLRSRGGNLDFTPLLRTDDSGGAIEYREILQAGPLGPQPRQRRGYVPSHQSYIMAARVTGKLPPPTPSPDAKDQPPPAAKPAHVVVVADLDMISDMFFNLRRDRPEGFEALDFDNVSFVLNCVDTLAGDESFLALRKRRPRHRTLEAVETSARAYRERNQEQDKKADEQAKDALKTAQDALDAKVEEVRKRTDVDERTKEVMLQSLQERENRRFTATKASIEIQRDREKEENKAARERDVRSIHSRIRALAILLPPLPALALAGIVFATRTRRENRGASPGRLA